MLPSILVSFRIRSGLDHLAPALHSDLVFIFELPSFLPLASGLLPGQNIPPQLDSLIHTITGIPIAGSASQAFPVIGTTTVNWGYGLGAYMFVLAAALRIIGVSDKRYS